MSETDADVLRSGRARFIRKLRPKIDALVCNNCQRTGTVMFSCYFVWMPVSGHISSSGLPENQIALLEGRAKRGDVTHTRLGQYCKSCFVHAIELWEEAQDDERK